MTDHRPDRVDSGFSRKNNSDLSLDELARRVRTADEGIALAAVNIVDLALTAGDALIQAKDKVELAKTRRSAICASPAVGQCWKQIPHACGI
jgi:hypothetical protein